MARRPVSTLPNLEQVLTAGSVSAQKLGQLRRYFSAALGPAGMRQSVGDPILLRKALVEQMRSEQVSPGTIQALEQCFMGIIRRAAVAGQLPAPPEGPWSRVWQSVLDMTKVKAGKSLVRSLAAWATDQALEPHSVGPSHLRRWVADLKLNASVVPATEAILREWKEHSPPVVSDEERGERLRKKAAHGSVSGV